MRSLEELQKIRNAFVDDLQKAQALKQSSLPCIVNHLPSQPVVKPGEIFQVISIGGTNFKSAMFTLGNDGQLIIQDKDSGIRDFFSTKEDLLSFIDRTVSPQALAVAINFAFPIEPVFRDGLLDARILAAKKNDTFEGLIDVTLGLLIEEHLGKTTKVSVANDTVCLLLAGRTRYEKNSLAAGIIGTGYNLAFFFDHEYAVNIEASSFENFTPTLDDKIIDLYAPTHGAIIEKEISGAYLYQQFNLLNVNEPDFVPLQSTEELDEIAKNDQDPRQVEAQQVFENSAQLVATHIAGILQFKQADLHFVMEGSLFWSAWQYKEIVEKWIALLAPDSNADFFQVEDSELWGGAQLLV